MKLHYYIKLIIFALPLALMVSWMMSFVSSIGIAFYLIDLLSIKGYWPVTLTFELDHFIRALFAALPYAIIISILGAPNRFFPIFASMLAYILASIILCLNTETLRPCFYALTLNTQLYFYFLICIFISCINGYRKRFNPARTQASVTPAK